MKGKTFHHALGIKLLPKVFKKLHSSLLLVLPFSWLPAILPYSGDGPFLLVVGLKSDGDLVSWSP